MSRPARSLPLGLLGAVLTLIVTLLLASGCEQDMEADVPPLSITVDQVYQEYQQNEARANSELKNRPLALSFQVDEIEDDHVVQRLGFIEYAELKFRQADLVTLNIGDTASSICELEGLTLDIWLRFDCR